MTSTEKQRQQQAELHKNYGIWQTTCVVKWKHMNLKTIFLV